MRVTFDDIKNSRVPAACGVCATDARFLAWVNEAQERLLYEGKWFGTYQRFKICATEGCITLPRQIATIEKVAICGVPIQNHDIWYEFIGPAIWNPEWGSCWAEANARGHFPTFSDMKGTDKKALLVCDLSTDVGKQVLVLGYDENANWIRTLQGGIYKDGELVTLAQSPGTQSINFFSTITDLQFPDDMDGQTWLYEYDITTMTQRMIGHYQYDETRPSYARYFFPTVSCLAKSSSCQQLNIDAIGKLEFIPVKNDTDYLIIGNIPALKEMCVALKNSEDEEDGVKANQIIAAGLATAKNILDKQLNHYLGDGRQVGVEIMGSSVGSLDPVNNFI